VTGRLAADLWTAHPDMRGLSGRNLRYMASLASRRPDGIGQHAAAQLPWGQVIELKLDRFEPEYARKLNFHVQLVNDHLRDQTRDDPTLGVLLVVGRDDVTVEVALRGISTPLAVTEWRRLPAKVRQVLPSAEDLTETVTRTVREVQSTAAAVIS
jgi:YhcG PDDEXK nuclease domain